MAARTTCIDAHVLRVHFVHCVSGKLSVYSTASMEASFLEHNESDPRIFEGVVWEE
jgi:hypothetical protein